MRTAKRTLNLAGPLFPNRECAGPTRPAGGLNSGAGDKSFGGSHSEQDVRAADAGIAVSAHAHASAVCSDESGGGRGSRVFAGQLSGEGPKHGQAADALAGQLATHVVDCDPLPLRGGAGLSVPVFGPSAQTSVLLPAWEPLDALSVNDIMADIVRTPKQSGRRKEKKMFQVPGESRQASVLTGYGIIPADNAGTAILHGQGRTAGSRDDGTAILADALLSAGVLQESDWCGGLEKSIAHGLTRWANDEKGAAAWRWFGPPLALVVTDDAPAYSTGVVLSRFRDHWRLPPGKPVGFFALRYQSAPRPVHVRRVVQDVEEAWPGIGYGLLNLLAMTFISSVNGYTPMWGARIAALWDQLDSNEWNDAFQEGEGTAFDFGDCIPMAAATTGFRLDALDAAIAKGGKCPRLLPVLTAARDVFDACRRAGKRYHTLNHCPFLSWNMSVGSRQLGALKKAHIEKLERAPVVYTVWDPENDVMTRLVDDYSEFARSTMQYTDFSWMHCYQAGFAGREAAGAVKWLAAKDRLVTKVAKHSPESLSFRDSDYVPEPMLDGGIRQAVTALSLVLDILGALDRLLTLLHTPETLMEQVRHEDERRL